MITELFETITNHEVFDDGAVLLRGHALPREAELAAAVAHTAAMAAFRHMNTPGGRTMSVAITSCGAAGWITDRHGYRYSTTDPLTREPWPAMPKLFFELARNAAAAAGYSGFNPDACLINHYDAGARMALHQDRDERDLTAPIVSVSLGLPATFLWGGKSRTDKPRRIPLFSGDVVVWGGPSRLNFHGITPIKPGAHSLCGNTRINLTFRKAVLF